MRDPVWGRLPRSRKEPPPRRRTRDVMNLEETIAVAVGIAVGIVFLAYFVIAGLSIGIG